MCGIALSTGPEADPATFRRMLAVLAPRGEVTETRQQDGLLAGVRRLRVVDRERAVQPWVSPDERHLLCYNGEVFNHHELRAELTRLGHDFRTAGDTEVVLAAFRQWTRRRCAGCAASTPSWWWSGPPAGRTWPGTRSGSNRSTGPAPRAACTWPRR